MKEGSGRSDWTFVVVAPPRSCRFLNLYAGVSPGSRRALTSVRGESSLLPKVGYGGLSPGSKRTGVDLYQTSTPPLPSGLRAPPPERSLSSAGATTLTYGTNGLLGSMRAWERQGGGCVHTQGLRMVSRQRLDPSCLRT